jgi:hypothetical protein
LFHVVIAAVIIEESLNFLFKEGTTAMRHIGVRINVLALLAIFLLGSQAYAADFDVLDALPAILAKRPQPPADDILHPPPGTIWQWQLTDDIGTSINVQMYDIDLFDVPKSVIDRLHAAGRIVICYFSAGSWENWRPDADQFPDEVKGNNLSGWPGEKWLDIRRLDILGPIIRSRMDLAVQKGCDGLESDNVDGYSNNTRFSLSPQDQIAYNTWLANEAHGRNLSIGLKNDLDQVSDLLPYFDWALNEQCFQYNECTALLPFVKAGKAVFGVEYSGDPVVFCPKANAMGFDWLKKNVNLDAWRIDCHNF